MDTDQNIHLITEIFSSHVDMPESHGSHTAIRAVNVLNGILPLQLARFSVSVTNQYPFEI